MVVGRVRLLVFSLSATALSLSSAIGAAEGAPTDERAERWTAALGLRLEDLQEAEPPTSEERKRVRAATDLSSSDLKGWELDRALAPRPRGEDRSPVAIVRVPLRDLEPARSLLAARDELGRLVAVAVLDEHDVSVPEWDALLASLAFATMPKLETARPRSELAKTLERARKGKPRADAPLILALSEVLGHMHSQAAALNLPPSARPTPVEQFATAKEEFAGLAEQTGELGSLLGAAAGRFEELARDSSELAARLETAFAESREAEIGELRGRLFQNCKSCHGLSGLAVPGEVKSAFAGKREELGIGDGYFELGHDLRITHPDLARAQRLADSLRGAILMLEADGDRIAAADGSYERGKTK